MEVVVAAQLLSKLLGVGLNAWKAWSSEGIDENESRVLAGLLEVADSARPKEGRPTAARLYVEVVVVAFGEAVRRHWAHPSLAPPRQQLEAAARMAVERLVDAGQGPAVVDLDAIDALRSPLASPAYQALWAVFSSGGPGDEPLLHLENEGKRAFERQFMLAWWDALSAPRTETLRRWLVDLDAYRARLVRDLIVADVGSWPERHVFGDEAAPVIPGLVLAGLWVDPLLGEGEGLVDDDTDEADDGTEWDDDEPTFESVVMSALDKVEEEVRRHRVVVITGPMGTGKSLLMRMYAARLAERWLSGPEPTALVPVPVPIRCGEDLVGADLEGAIRRALQRAARNLGLDRRLDDFAAVIPNHGERAIILLDGLDEAGLGPREAEALFARLQDEASSEHRFLVFARPGGLPPRDHLRDARVLRLEPFDPPRIAQWLNRFERLTGKAIAPSQIEERGLGELASTPMLLFMIAHGWDEAVGQSGGAIYEAFLSRLARGKHELDRDRHPAIAAASEHLREVLSSPDPVEAMLWMMSRVAWEGERVATRNRELNTRAVDAILEDELGVHDARDVVRAIRVGLLLVLPDGEGRVAFGHRSFAEYLAARYWTCTLKRIVEGRERDWPEHEGALYGARLGMRARTFLLERLASWDADSKRALRRWAEDTANDDRVEAHGGRWRDDRRPWLRETALAIGSALGGVEVRDPEGLRSLLAWFWATGQDIALQASHCLLLGVDLSSAPLPGSDFADADLTGGVLVDAHLDRACFVGASMVGAQMAFVRAQGADFDRALLSDADLFRMQADHSSWAGASLSGVRAHGLVARWSDFAGARLDDIDLSDADLRESSFEDADLRRALLQGADLRQIRGVRANLREAVLVEADLRGADLRGADLRGADLTAADLRGTDVTGADLTESVLDEVLRD